MRASALFVLRGRVPQGLLHLMLHYGAHEILRPDTLYALGRSQKATCGWKATTSTTRMIPDTTDRCRMR